MRAKEMFELLGYTYIKNESSIYCDDFNNEEKFFSFYLQEKRVFVGYYSYSIEEHKAIHQQMKELGWL